MAGPFARKSLSVVIASICGVAVAPQIAMAATGNNPIQLGNVEGTASSLVSTPVAKVLKSASGVKVISKKQIKFTGPTSGSAAALKIAPGVEVAGYGAGGSTKNSISIDGVKQGWGGAAGSGADDGSVSVTFDGLPMTDPATGLWQSDLIPQMFMIQNVGLTYGPGSAKDRWYNNIGGQIDFEPVQPSKKMGGKVQLTYGSYDTQNMGLVLQSGEHDGWATVLAGGAGSNNNFRKAAGSNSPASNYAWFLKTRKEFTGGDFSFGLYDAKSVGYRPNYIPLNPIGVTVNGYNAAGTPNPGKQYSQSTSGYYTALAYNVWHKQDTNAVLMYYAKLNVALDSISTFHNYVWYKHAHRLHEHWFNIVPNQTNLIEHNNPHNNMFGDKTWVDFRLPYNTVSVGAWFQRDIYNTRNAFYNPIGSPVSTLTQPSAFRSDYFDSTYVAGFLQDEIKPVKSVEITPGVRVIGYGIRYWDGGVQDFPNGSAANNQALGHGQPAAQSTYFQKVEPSLGATWKATHHMAFNAYYGMAYREPANGGGGGPFQSVPAYRLQLEKGTNYQLGVKFHYNHTRYLNNFLASVDYFYTKFANQYISSTTAAGDTLPTGQGSSHYTGVNASVEDEPVNNVYVFANGNVEQAKFDTYEVSGTYYNGRWVTMVPDYTFNVGGSYKWFTRGIVFEPRAWYSEIGTQHMWDNNISAPSNSTIPSYGVLNLGLDVDIPTQALGGHMIKLSLQVLNALNKKYNEYEYVSSGAMFGNQGTGSAAYNTVGAGDILAYPGAPTTAYLTLTADF